MHGAADIRSISEGQTLREHSLPSKSVVFFLSWQQMLYPVRPKAIPDLYTPTALGERPSALQNKVLARADIDKHSNRKTTKSNL